jgi:anti-sigma factor RsiW
MSNFNEAQFEDLLSRYLDAQLDPGEEERLRQYLTNEGYSRRFLELTKLNAEIAGLSAAPVPDAVMVELVMRELRDDSKPALPFPVPPMAVEDYSTPEVVGKPPHPRAASYRGPLLAMAACLCLLGVAAAFFS